MMAKSRPREERSTMTGFTLSIFRELCLSTSHFAAKRICSPPWKSRSPFSAAIVGAMSLTVSGASPSNELLTAKVTSGPDLHPHSVPARKPPHLRDRQTSSNGAAGSPPQPKRATQVRKRRAPQHSEDRVMPLARIMCRHGRGSLVQKDRVAAASTHRNSGSGPSLHAWARKFVCTQRHSTHQQTPTTASAIHTARQHYALCRDIHAKECPECRPRARRVLAFRFFPRFSRHGSSRCLMSSLAEKAHVRGGFSEVIRELADRSALLSGGAGRAVVSNYEEAIPWVIRGAAASSHLVGPPLLHRRCHSGKDEMFAPFYPGTGYYTN